MRKRNVIFLNPPGIQDTLDAGYIMFVRPMGGKIFRCFVPEDLKTNEEVMDLIKLWSTRYINDIYYIRANSTEMLWELGQTFYEMSFDQFVISEPAEECWIPGADQKEPNKALLN